MKQNYYDNPTGRFETIRKNLYFDRCSRYDTVRTVETLLTAIVTIARKAVPLFSVIDRV
jgi:hypothetical protein